MAFTEKPPMLRGSTQEQVNALRDYLFRMASALDEAATAPLAGSGRTQITTNRDGTKVIKNGAAAGKDIEAVQKNAQELKSLIVKSAKELESYCDAKVEEYDARYVSTSEFGSFEENITSRIETTAKGVIEEYGYSAEIDSIQDSIDLIQRYYSQVNGEIRRGIVEDPETGRYVTGIAISQNLKFSGECGPSDGNNPGDGYTYYYLNSGQTFGLYTSTGWQFWIDGYKKGWFDSVDGMLHVANIVAENALQIGSSWQIKSATDGSEFEIIYVGV